MRTRTLLIIIMLTLALALPAGAKTLKFAFQGDIQSFDRHLRGRRGDGDQRVLWRHLSHGDGARVDGLPGVSTFPG